jgi:hypothetical protein
VGFWRWACRHGRFKACRRNSSTACGARAEILGGEEERIGQAKWTRPGDAPVHILIGLNALLDPATGEAVPDLEQETLALQQLCQKHGIEIVGGHGAPESPWQEAKAILEQNKATYKPVPREHFGFYRRTSANPVFEASSAMPMPMR